MTNNVKRFFSLFLALSLVFGLVVPAAATETDDHSHEQTSEASPVAAETAEETTEAASDEIQFGVSLDNITVKVDDLKFNVSLITPAMLSDIDDEDIDREDPAIIGFESNLRNITVWDEASQKSVALTDEQINQLLYFYGEDLKFAQEHADVLGMQTPFFLDFQDDKDELGALGEFMALDPNGTTVDDLREGRVSFDTVLGMVMNFYYGDQLGVAYYESAIKSARDAALEAVEKAGGNNLTDVQKLLVLNDWIAHRNTFDMAYIMNEGKDNPIMFAESPEKNVKGTKTEHYDEVLEQMRQLYKAEDIRQSIEDQVRAGIEADFKVKVYMKAIRDTVYQINLAQLSQDEEFLASVRDEQWEQDYEEAKAAEKERVYQEAYEQYMRENVHSAVVTVKWNEKTEGDVTTYEAEVTEVKCADEGCEEVLTAEGVKTTSKTTATCLEAGETTYTAEVTIKDSKGNVIPVENTDALTKTVDQAPLGHDFDEDGKCQRKGCDVTAHTHKAKVTLTWSKPDNLKYEASVDSVVCEGETPCNDTLTASVKTSSENTLEATCTVDGEVTYTAEVTVVDSKNQPVADVKVENPEQLDAIKAPGHNYENGVCTRCKAEKPVTHTHNLTVAISWDTNNQPSATVNCTEDCTGLQNVEANVQRKETVVKNATCTEPGQVKYTATVTVTENGTDLPATSYTTNGTECPSNPVTIPALDHAFDDDGICSRCGAVSESHSHVVTVTLDWKGDQAEARGECACKDTFTVDVSVKEVGTAYEAPTCGKEGSRTYEATIGAVTDSKGNVVAGTAVTPPSNTTNKVSIPATGNHSFGTGPTCEICGAPNPNSTPRPEAEASSASATPEFFTFTQTAAVAAEEEGETTPDADEEINPEADTYAKQIVEEKQEEIEKAAAQAADEKNGIQEKLEEKANELADQYIAENEPAIKANPVDFVDGKEVTVELEDGTTKTYQEQMFLKEMPVMQDGQPVLGEDGQPIMMPLNEQFHQAWAAFWKEAQETGVEVDPVNAPGYKMTVDQLVEKVMDEPMEGMPQDVDENGNPIFDEEGNPVYMSPNKAAPIIAEQAAVGMTDGIITYWEGCHIGALSFGTSVCLGYTKALNYLVQVMHPEVYGKNESSNMKVASNWRTREELYGTGDFDSDSGYIVDCVRIKFNAEVSMFGVKEDNFQGDHYWNAVKVDGKWYYVDPCYNDIYTEVMDRDRVETDGQMNHLYFLLSHTSAAEMYDGYMEIIRTRYEDLAVHKDYEDAWVSRIKSNTYFDGGYAYYAYDSTDMITIMEEANNNPQDYEQEYVFYKIVRHALSQPDIDDGDKDYETLIFFNHKEDPDNDDETPVALVLNPETGKLEESETLTELYARHETYAQIYPSISITTSLYNGKMYFNLANCILSYDIATGEVKLVKEYNEVSASRNPTIEFGGMAFTIDPNGTHTVNDAPIAGLTVKNDGQMYVSVATRFGFISGKEAVDDQSSYGYEFQESNYNPNYNSYMNQKINDYGGQIEGISSEENDNDEFMWSANFVEKLTMSHLDGSSHSYESVSVPATCGVDAYTENRCTSCGASEDGSRVYEEGTALDHHFVEFHETYYTKGDNGNFNTGDCCVCTICGFAVTDPKEDANDEDQQAYDAIKATAGHTYEPVDGVWAEDNASVTFSKVECSSVCPDRKTKLDCLLSDDLITLNLDEETTLEATEEDVEGGSCAEGFDKRYVAEGTAIANGKQVAVTATKYVEGEPIEGGCVFDKETWEVDDVNHWHVCTVCGTKHDEAAHEFDEDGVCTICGYNSPEEPVETGVTRISGSDRVKTALKIAETLKETLKKDTFDTIIVVNGANDKFPDPLTGSYLASVAQAPILMCSADSVSQETLDFIRENLDSNGKIYLLGGVNSISEDVEAKLGELAENVVRLAGNDRFATNLEILAEAESIAEAPASEILIARGDNFADSLSASATGLPILVVQGKGKLSQAQKDYLLAHQTCTVTILGGVNSVSEDIRAEIETLLDKDGEIDRVAGDTREETSAAIAERYFPNAKFATITYSQGPADGLCGGVLANALNAPMLLTNAGQTGVTNGYIAKYNILSGYVLGGPNSVSDDTVRAAFGLAEDAVINAK